MFREEDFLVGVKLEPPARAQPSRNVWDRLKHAEKAGLCLHCERHRWKNRELKLCDKCYRACPRHKCLHCKEEFSSHKYCRKAEATYKRLVCLNCARNIATFSGDAKLCRFCGCWSAWRESAECDRCFKMLEKFGNPSNCESCSRNCAFDRGEESRSKVSGLRLCFLCTYDFKKNDYYNKRRLNLNHIGYRGDAATPASADGPAAESEAGDPEKEFLRRRVAELEAELQSLRDAHAQLQARFGS